MMFTDPNMPAPPATWGCELPTKLDVEVPTEATHVRRSTIMPRILNVIDDVGMQFATCVALDRARHIMLVDVTIQD